MFGFDQQGGAVDTRVAYFAAAAVVAFLIAAVASV